MPQIERAEKRTFGRHEALDFTTELKKRNLELVVAYDETNEIVPGTPALVAYLVFVYSKPGNTVTLHKICVQKSYRRRGVARFMLSKLVERLKKQGASKIQLWVDESNASAKLLYQGVGFEEVGRVSDYYAINRTGVQMALDLS